MTLFSIPVFLVEALTENINAVNENGLRIETVTTDEDIYISGICEAAAGTHVEVFVVNDRGTWKDETVLTDVSGTVESIKVDADGEVPLSRVWTHELDEGEYDVVLDSDGNKEYDEDEDCVADKSGTGFTVINKGAGSVRLGSRNPDPDEELRWRVLKDDPFVTLLVLRIFADDLEDLRITSFILQARGTVSDHKSIEQVIIAEDRGNDGFYTDGRDVVWGTGEYRGDGAELTVATDAIVPAGTSKTVLVTYLMGKELRDDTTFQVNVSKVEAEGMLSEEDIRLSGLPLRSAVAVVVGSGDAQIVEEATVPETAEDDSVWEVPTDSRVTAFVEKFIPSREGGDESDKERSTSKEGTPVWMQMTVFIALVVIGLVVLWKIVQWIISLVHK